MSNKVENHFDFDVLIAGGGPVGATLAGYLGGRGIKTLLVEAGDGVVKDCRMHLVNIRTMEIMRNLGLEDHLRNCGWPKDYVQDVSFVTHLDGEELARIAWPAIEDMPVPAYSPTFNQRCPQAWFNPIVLDYAESQTATEVRYHSELENFVQDATGVRVDLRDDADRRSSVRVKYLVGCDGSRSTVRRVMGVSREGAEPLGQSVEVVFRSPDLAQHMRMGPAGRFITLSKRGMSASVMPFDGIDRYRMTLMVQPSKITLDEMAEEIRALTVEPFEFEIITPLLPWINRATSAETYVKGRVALAGDAAHSMPPTGGFGMNSGIQDAYDLGWRLMGLIEGWGGPLLLESYDCERRAAIDRISAMATAVYKDWIEWSPKVRDMAHKLEESGPEAEEFRSELGQTLLSVFGREFNSQGGPLGYRYLDSPIVVPDNSPEPPDAMEVYEQVARPGHRAPHMWLEDGRSTLDLFGDKFTLLSTIDEPIDGAWAACAQELGIPFHAYRLNEADARDVFGAAQILVRPDGIVAWRSERHPESMRGLLLKLVGQGSDVAHVEAQANSVQVG